MAVAEAQREKGLRFFGYYVGLNDEWETFMVDRGKLRGKSKELTVMLLAGEIKSFQLKEAET